MARVEGLCGCTQSPPAGRASASTCEQRLLRAADRRGARPRLGQATPGHGGHSLHTEARVGGARGHSC